MIKYTKNILLRSLIVAILVLFISIWIGGKLEATHNNIWFFYFTPFYAFLINLIAYRTATKGSNVKNFNLQVMSLFGIKFFAYIVVILVFFLLEPEKSTRLIYIGFIFFLYILNNIILLTEILNYQKTIQK